MGGQPDVGNVDRPAVNDVDQKRGEQETARLQLALDRRAQALARPQESHAPGDTVEALVFRLGQEHYAFPLEEAVEVRPLTQLTPLPSAPSFVAGLINVRGRIVPVLDLRPLFGLPAPAESGQTVLLVSTSRGNIGLLATDRPDVRRLAGVGPRALSAGAPPGLDAAYVRGVSPEMVVMLDAERLLTDARLVVQEDTL